ncbi:MAG: hypothetical protein IPH44_34055 [Myxococcales bacterium]|nr:hypothetical protein [Myxococcales bacterium]
MPENDQIFDRLRAATDAERMAIAAIFDVEPTATVETLSRALRKQAGNLVLNVFRKDHELRYAQILADVVVEAARKAGWPAPAIDEMAWSRWAEDYTLQALAFAKVKDRATKAQADEAQALAEAALKRDADTGAVGSIVRKTGMTFAIGFDKVVAAVLVLIQIRLREKAEQDLRRAQ